MSSMVRKLMRGIFRGGNRRQLGGSVAVGSQRAGMHAAAEHEYQRSRMAEAADPVPETVEDALDMPAALEEEIPAVEEDDNEIVEEIAEGEAGVAAEEEIVEEIAEPDAALTEEEVLPEGETVPEEEILGVRDKGPGARMAVDYSAERIPVLDPVVEGGSDPETPLEYSSGDSELKEIQEPLPGMGEMYGVEPYIPETGETISAGVPELDFNLDSEGNLVVSSE